MTQGFSVAEITRLTGVTAKTLHFWDRSGFLSPSLVQANGTGSRRIYDFRDLVAIRVAAQLRAAGISLQSLRKVVDLLRSMGDLDQPLAETYLVTDGHDVYAKRGEELLSLLRQPRQQVFAFVIDITHTVERLRDEIRALRQVSNA